MLCFKNRVPGTELSNQETNKQTKKAIICKLNRQICTTTNQTGTQHKPFTYAHICMYAELMKKEISLKQWNSFENLLETNQQILEYKEQILCTVSPYPHFVSFSILSTPILKKMQINKLYKYFCFIISIIKL